MTDVPNGVLIRGRNSDDWKAVATICRALRPELNPLELPFVSDDYAREELGKTPDNVSTFGLVAEWEGKVVGETGMSHDSGRRRHIGEIYRLIVDPAFQGQGIGGMLLGALIDLAENWLNLSRVSHIVSVDNAPAIALHRKYGFVIEGKMRDYAYRGGRYVDAYEMARVRDAF